MKLEFFTCWAIVATIMATILIYHCQTIEAAKQGVRLECCNHSKDEKSK